MNLSQLFIVIVVLLSVESLPPPYLDSSTPAKCKESNTVISEKNQFRVQPKIVI